MNVPTRTAVGVAVLTLVALAVLLSRTAISPHRHSNPPPIEAPAAAAARPIASDAAAGPATETEAERQSAVAERSLSIRAIDEGGLGVPGCRVEVYEGPAATAEGVVSYRIEDSLLVTNARGQRIGVPVSDLIRQSQ